MLLSPFLPGKTDALAEWLGGGNIIKVDWKPSEKIVLGLRATKTKATFHLLPSAYSFGLYDKEEFEIRNPYALSSTSDKKKILEFSCRHFYDNGKTNLILCKGKVTANETAEQIYNWTEHEIDSDEVNLIRKYIDEELGCTSLFSRVLGRGVAVHHAGLSDETKLLTEHLIRKGLVNYVCATTTIAEGVNFPVSTVYFDTYNRGDNILSANDFWNIADVNPRWEEENTGISLVLINTPKGRKIFENLSAEYLPSDYQTALRGNPSIEKSAIPHRRRKKFFRLFGKRKLSTLIEEMLKPAWYMHIHALIRSIIRNHYTDKRYL